MMATRPTATMTQGAAKPSFNQEAPEDQVDALDRPESGPDRRRKGAGHESEKPHAEKDRDGPDHREQAPALVPCGYLASANFARWLSHGSRRPARPKGLAVGHRPTLSVGAQPGYPSSIFAEPRMAAADHGVVRTENLNEEHLRIGESVTMARTRGLLRAAPVVPRGEPMTAGAAIQTMVDRIVREFQPLRIVLFGSHARGTAVPESDIDLLVVLPTVADKRQTTVQIRRVLGDLPVSKDIVVTTPDEIRRRGQLVGSVLRPALREGRVLYARA